MAVGRTGPVSRVPGGFDCRSCAGAGGVWTVGVVYRYVRHPHRPRFCSCSGVAENGQAGFHRIVDRVDSAYPAVHLQLQTEILLRLPLVYPGWMALRGYLQVSLRHAIFHHRPCQHKPYGNDADPLYRTIYFFIRSAPVQFKVTAIITVCWDCAVLAQRFIYRADPPISARRGETDGDEDERRGLGFGDGRGG